MMACYSNILCESMTPDLAAKVAEYVLMDPSYKGMCESVELEVL
jgi:hypothetical protein